MNEDTDHRDDLAAHEPYADEEYDESAVDDLYDEIDDLARTRDGLERQVVELLRLRDRMTAEMREVLRYTARAMAAVERGEVAAPPEELEPLPLAEELREGDGTAEVALVLEVGPLLSFPAVSTLEQELAAAGGVTDVYVRRYDGTRAQIDVAVAGEAAARTFRTWLEERFQVEERDADHLVLYVIQTQDSRA